MRIVRSITLLAALTLLSACASTDWNQVYSGMSNNGVFKQ